MRKNMGKKVGIMGGTFNPIHNGHLILAESAREAFGLDEIIFMPSGNSYMKNAASILDGETRACMTELAIKDNPYFRLSRMELEREGPTYTCDTLAQLKKQDTASQYFFIMGADNLFILEKWKNAVYVLQNCVIAAAARGEEAEEDIRKEAGRLKERYQADIRLLLQRRIDISSLEIRDRLLKGQSVRYLLPESVLSYICERELYSLAFYHGGKSEKR